MFKEAREAIYARLRAARISAAPSDIATHTQLIQAEQIADQFFSFFDFALQTGKMAQAHIDELAQRRKGLGERLAAYGLWGRSAL